MTMILSQPFIKQRQIILLHQNQINSNIFESPDNIIQPSHMIIRKCLLIVVFMCSLITVSYSYLQLKLVRIPHPTKKYKYMKSQCLSALPSEPKKESDDDDDDDDDDQDSEKQQIKDDDDFKQICYDKDISYAIQLYNKDLELLLFSIDLTTPISWMKGQNCKIAGTHKKCSRIQMNFKEQIELVQKKFKDLIKNPWNTKKKKRKQNQFALIQGSSEVVKGVLEKTQDLVFETRDSGRLTRMIDVLLIGLAVIGEKDMLTLHNTTFIKATDISANLNFLCDGAISFRFDQNSQNSFLNEISKVTNNQEKYVTIFIGTNNQSLTIGDLSVRNSAEGLAGIRWISIKQEQHYGKLPLIKQIWVASKDLQSHKEIKVKKYAVLSLSSSCITIPSEQISKILSNIFKKSSSNSKCEVESESGYIMCKNMTNSEKSELSKKELHFVTQENPISISLKDLVIQQDKKRTVLNIKQSTDTNFIILGQPIFKHYFVVLDYENNRIGFAPQRTKFIDTIVDVVFLIRFVLWIFILGCCCILCVSPIDRLYRIFREKSLQSKRKGQGKRLKQYQKIDENGYEDLNRQIQKITSNDISEAEGI